MQSVENVGYFTHYVVSQPWCDSVDVRKQQATGAVQIDPAEHWWSVMLLKNSVVLVPAPKRILRSCGRGEFEVEPGSTVTHVEGVVYEAAPIQDVRDAERRSIELKGSRFAPEEFCDRSFQLTRNIHYSSVGGLFARASAMT